MKISGAVQIQEQSQIGEARRRIQTLAEQLGFDETEAGKLAIIVTELGTNLIKHTSQGGEIIYRAVRSSYFPGIEVLALDQGAGMVNPQICMGDGFSSQGTSGIGLGGVQRLSHFFDLYSREGAGTAVLARVWARDPVMRAPVGAKLQEAPGWELGAVCIPYPGEVDCGDSWSFIAEESSAQLLVADGLGHGPLAAEAAEAAVREFERIRAKSAPEVIQACHDVLVKTRGAAVAVASLEPGRAMLEYSGVGNISGSIWIEDKSQSMVSMNGILGQEFRSARAFSYVFPPGALLILHSDGLTSRWNLNRYPGLLNRHPSLIAGILYRESRRGKDDVTVVVARRGSR